MAMQSKTELFDCHQRWRNYTSPHLRRAMKIWSTEFLCCAAGLFLSLSGAACTKPGDSDDHDQASHVITHDPAISHAGAWQVERDDAQEVFADLDVAADGTLYALARTGAAPFIKLLAKQDDVFIERPIAWSSPFAAPHGARLVTDGTDVVVGVAEFYHVEVVRLHGGDTRPLFQSTDSAVPHFAKSASGRIVLRAGLFIVDLELQPVAQMIGTLAFDGEALLAAGAGIVRVVENGPPVPELVAPPNGRVIRSFWADGKGSGVAVGDGGLVYQRKVGSPDWLPVDVGVEANLTRVWGASASEIYVVGDEGTVLAYDGSSWSKESVGTTANLRAVIGTATHRVFIAGDGILLRRD
jgi:hypothetical protein